MTTHICPKTWRACELTGCQGDLCRGYSFFTISWPPLRYGWICPRCNAVKSPDAQTCGCTAPSTMWGSISGTAVDPIWENSIGNA